MRSDLDRFLVDTLHALIGPSDSLKHAGLEKARLSSDLSDCLKIYDMLCAWPDAEEIVRREVVRGFVKKVWSGSSRIIRLLNTP